MAFNPMLSFPAALYVKVPNTAVVPALKLNVLSPPVGVQAGAAQETSVRTALAIDGELLQGVPEVSPALNNPRAIFVPDAIKRPVV